MRGTALVASWVFVSACVFVACGGAGETDLFTGVADGGSSGTSGT